MISLIVPAYNEEAYIRSTLKELSGFAARTLGSYEIIVVDDGSSDRTGSVVESWMGEEERRGINLVFLKNERNRGKGYAVRRAMLQADGEFCMFIDADLPFELSSVSRMIERYQAGSDLVIGNRNDPKSTLSKIRPIRHAAGKTYSLFVQLLLKSHITDTQCGLKGFNRHAAKTIFSRTKIDGFGFDVEVLYIAEKFGLKIERIPVQMRTNRMESRVDIFNDSLEMFRNLFMIKGNDLRGRYD